MHFHKFAYKCKIGLVQTRATPTGFNNGCPSNEQQQQNTMCLLNAN